MVLWLRKNQAIRISRKFSSELLAHSRIFLHLLACLRKHFSHFSHHRTSLRTFFSHFSQTFLAFIAFLASSRIVAHFLAIFEKFSHLRTYRGSSRPINDSKQEQRRELILIIADHSD
jgi:hypothetical protein